MKCRFVVVDYGEVVHPLNTPCPPWCHLCPHMDGKVMPHCYGSAISAFDENDLLACTCDPSDPIVAHADLVDRLYRMISMLREKRRERRTDRVAVKRLGELARAMRWSRDQNGLVHAWEEVAGIARRLETCLTSQGPCRPNGDK